MSTDINLKELERKAYTSYNQDGLLDIAIGLAILAFGIGMATDNGYLGGILPALGVPVWAAAKRAITVPRVGLVRFSAARQIRIKKEHVFFVGFFTVTMLAGVAMFFLSEGGSPGPDAWLRKFIMAPLGLFGSIGLGFLAYWKQVNRYFAYAALVLTAVFGGPLLNIAAPQYVMALGIAMLLAGLALLIQFLRKYPMPVEEA